jgi:hypothetical protein
MQGGKRYRSLRRRSRVYWFFVDDGREEILFARSCRGDRD